MDLGIGLLPYYPLAKGLLSGKYRRDQAMPEGTRLSSTIIDDDTWSHLEALESFAKERGHSLLDLAIGGLAAQPTVASVIAGATRPEQVVANATASDWELTADDLAALGVLLSRRV